MGAGTSELRKGEHSGAVTAQGTYGGSGPRYRPGLGILTPARGTEVGNKVSCSSRGAPELDSGHP